MSGRVVHFEIPYGEGDRARAFYAEAFGWELLDIPEMSYTMATTGPSGETGPTEPGFINGGMMRRESPTEGPVVVIDVPDIEASLAKIESLGGSTVLGKQAVGEMGFAAYFKDVEGNIMGLWQSA
ncbi:MULTISPECIES: VOC family protein [unclassified Nocardioides]|uniref:VOC family protein n=1 Tax=unclassified Nocardioides TaxID=2615069 RepID=UPI0006F34BB9|nr:MULTISPECIES: VOC family protein [unclassified Nocardioides]KQY62600.1 glyoxalase [Nocardioides sp. Root140]KRF15073.1 glyoxalase [Nocardioides sp. Soil796]